MQAYLVRRVIQMIPVFFGITFISFMLIRLAPGDPIATLYPPEMLARVDQELLREQLGLNDPIPVQYVRMMGEFVSGELMSFQERRPTHVLIFERLPITMMFALLAIFYSLLIGIPIALIAALRPYSILDNVTTTIALMGLSLPQFWIALIFILIFSERLRWLPATGIRPIGSQGYVLAEMIPHLIMPTVVLTLGLLPSVLRYTRSSLLETLKQGYIRTARSKGLRERKVMLVHALRNAILPVISFVGVIFPALLGGAVLVETIFGLPGMGRLAVRAAENRDFPVILSLNMLAAVLVLFSNMLTDIIYTFFDPRIRLQ